MSDTWLITVGIVLLSPLAVSAVWAYVAYARFAWRRPQLPTERVTLKRDRLVWIGYHVLVATIFGVILLGNGLS